MAQYNGHKNWNHWNVSLWLSNDHNLYWRMVETVRDWPTKDRAARELLDSLPEKTPDGASYSVSSIRAAMVGID